MLFEQFAWVLVHCALCLCSMHLDLSLASNPRLEAEAGSLVADNWLKGTGCLQIRNVCGYFQCCLQGRSMSGKEILHKANESRRENETI